MLLHAPGKAKRPVILIILPLLLIAALIATHQPERVQACTPPPKESQRASYPDRVLVDRLPTLMQRAETAEIIFVGTVTELSGTVFTWTVTVSVDFYLKATGGPGQVEIGVFGQSSICLSPVQVGDYAIFFAQGDPFSGSLKAHYSPWRDAAGNITDFGGQFNATATATADNIQTVTDIAGQEPVPPPATGAPVPPEEPTETTVFSLIPTPTSTPTAKALELATPTGPTGEAATSAPEPTAEAAEAAPPADQALGEGDPQGSGGSCSAPAAGGGKTDIGLLGLLAGIAALAFIRRIR